MSDRSTGYHLVTWVRLGHSRWERGDHLRAALTSLRRLVASMMLVAMTSFVLHGAAMVSSHRHVLASHDCERADHVHVKAQGSTHVHADGSAHVHHAQHDLEGADHKLPDRCHADGGEADCCGTVCAVAIAAAAPNALSVLLRVAKVRPLLDQDGSGADLSGLKRPPRITDIA
jgi:hypothetical protein